MSKDRKLRLGAFIMATGHHIAAWRHPDSDADAGHNIDHYRGLAQTAERGLFDLVFVADSPGRLGRRPRSRDAQPGQPLGALRAGDPVVGAVAGDRADRLRRHRLDHLRGPLPPGAQVRLARPHQQGPRGLERRDHRRRRLEELLHRRPPRACQPLRARRGIRRSRARPLGQLRGRRADPRQGDAASSSIPTRSTSVNHKGKFFDVAGPAQRRALAAGPAGGGAGRRLRAGPRARRAHRRGDLHRQPDAGRRPGVLLRHQGAARQVSAAGPSSC